MLKTEMEALAGQFTGRKEFIEDGYYRIQMLDDSRFELAFMLADSCGTTAYHPRIVAEVRGDEVVPVSLLDYVSHPIKNMERTEANGAELDEALVALVDKLRRAKAVQD